MVKVVKKSPSMLSVYRQAVLKKNKPGFKAGDALPELAWQLAKHTVNTKHLRRYNAVCRLPQADYLPATYPQIIAFPLQLGMLLDKHFPFALLGMVHVRNQISVLKPIHRKAELGITVSIAEQRVVEKGVELDINTEVTADGELSWTGVATMLARCKTEVVAGDKKPTAEPLNCNRQTWALATNLGRCYGRASGDLNPIHIAALSAKAFGFKRHIAHGMWTKARCLAALDGQLMAAPYQVDVRFKLPIFLPAKVQYFQRDSVRQEQSRIEFEVWDKEGKKPHLAGSVSSL